MRYNYDNPKNFQKKDIENTTKVLNENQINELKQKYTELVTKQEHLDTEVYGEPKNPVQMDKAFFMNYMKDIGLCFVTGVLTEKEPKEKKIISLKNKKSEEKDGTEAWLTVNNWIRNDLENPALNKIYKDLFSNHYVVEYRENEENGKKYVAICPKEETKGFYQKFYIRE